MPSTNSGFCPQPPCPAARLSILRQVALSLAIAESELHFEHRDLHWGNVLVRPCRSDLFERSDTCQFCSPETLSHRTHFRLNGSSFDVPTHGLVAVIIDFTLSRLEQDGGLVYVDLSTDPTLFESKGDYQFDVYRLMRKHNRNQWKKFTPMTNVMWLNYLVKKLCSVDSDDHYPQDPRHVISAKLLSSLEPDLDALLYRSACDLVLNHSAFADTRLQ
ncbi:unnamed protein product [Echinostoma caproni]|uniref:non-specific serine/threonine protein kinase n=1 Tax=Echinostoma caproni TaxID=27848 RepID=A0A183AKB7_9TREM|nr:unnamed protein product [Echinostoma caproni]